MRYEVPNYRLKELIKMIKRAQGKGANISFRIIREFEKEFEIVVNDSASRTADSVKVMTTCSEIEINGEYKENGWEFVATIEHTPNGNIIRCINSEYEKSIPSKYLTCGPECEHCHTIRSRKDTYLVYNSENKEFKQVGKTCLLDFTKGLTPETCEAFAGVFDFCASCKELDGEEFMSGFSTSPDFGFSSENAKKLAYGIVKKFGYEKSDTPYSSAKKLTDCIFNRKSINDLGIKPATDEEIKAVDTYADSIYDGESGYMRNAKLAWLNNMTSARDFALICSFVSVYFRKMQQLAKEKVARETTNYVGNIGDKITVDVANYRCLYNKYTRISNYNSAISYIYEIIGKDGNTYIWSSSNKLEGDIKQVIGTIKDHKEYKGVKQTVLTRCKVIM